MQVGVHAGLEHWYASKLLEFGSVCFVIESARDENVKSSLTCFTGSLNQIRAGYCAKLGAYEDSSAFLCSKKCSDIFS
jgi:hypothetical protein